MVKPKKSTRKFQAHHLGRTLQQRKAAQKKRGKARPAADGTSSSAVGKQATVGKKRSREEAKEQHAEEKEGAAGVEEEEEPEPRPSPSVDDLDVDDFMQSGLLGGDDEDEDDDEDDAEVLETGADDEQEDDADDDDVAEQRLLDEIAQHEADIKALSKRDPAFYKHLQENDADLLAFNKDAVMRDDDDEEEAEEVKQATNKKCKTGKEAAVISLPAWRLIKQQASSHSLTALRKTLRLFRLAAHSNDADAETVPLSSALYDDVLRFSISVLPDEFAHHFKGSKTLQSHGRFSVLGPLLKAYLTSYIHLLSSSQDNKLTRLLLSTALTSLVPLFSPFYKLALRVIRQLLVLWSTADRSTRIDAFLLLRALCQKDAGLLEESMKGIYLTYVSYARWTSQLNIGVLRFMVNCIVELYGLDGGLAYQYSFVYIRQLAIHLRNAIQGKKDAGDKGKGKGRGKGGKGKEGEGYRAIYNWQFINCIRVWNTLLATLATQPASGSSSSPLRPLLYPHVQVALGVLTLLPSSRYHPLRLIVCEMLCDLSAACHLFIPVLPTLLSLFSSPELSKPPTSVKSPDIRYVIKVSKATAMSRAYQEQLYREALRLILRYCTIHSYALAYPELILPTVRGLRAWSKGSRVGRLKKDVARVVEKLEHSADWSRKLREACDWTPKDALEGKVDAMYAFRGGEGKEGFSPLERYEKMDRGEGGDDDTNEDDMDWDGTKGAKKQARDAENLQEEDEEEQDAEEEEGDEDDELEDEEDMMDMDGMDGMEDEDLDDEEKTQAKPPQKKQKAAPPAKPRTGEEGKADKAEKQSKRTPVGLSADAEEDVVTELVLSDEDGEE